MTSSKLPFFLRLAVSLALAVCAGRVWALSGVDIGAPAPAGSMIDNGRELVVTVGGVGVGGVDRQGGSGNRGDPSYTSAGASDSFHFVYQPWTGEGEVVVRVASLSGPDGAQAGVMVRSGLDAAAWNVFYHVARNGGIVITARDYSTVDTRFRDTTWDHHRAGTGTPVPLWLKLVRAGRGVMSYASTDGTNWTELKWVNAPLDDQVQIGLGVASGQAGVPATATFDNLRIGAVTTPVSAPPTPANLIEAGGSPNHVQLGWEGNATLYERVDVERAVGDGPFQLLYSRFSAPASQWETDRTVVTGTTYRYRVRAARGSVVSAYSNPLTVTVQPQPNAPTSLAGTARSSSQIDLTWTDNSDNETGFVIYRWLDFGGQATFVAPANATAFSDTTVSADLKYYYAVYARGRWWDSAASNRAEVITPPLPPTSRSPIAAQPADRAAATGSRVTLSVQAVDSAATFQWRRNGRPIAGATQASWTIDALSPEQAGIYTAAVSDAAGSEVSRPAIVGVLAADKITGHGVEVLSNVRHPNTNVYDQVLLTGPWVSVRADPGQVTRTSFLSENHIVQVEFSGAGTLTLTLDDASGPAAPDPHYYNQPDVKYMSGRAHIVIAGADETTHVAVFSVGRGNAVNQALFNNTTFTRSYAYIGSLAIQSANGRFGGVYTGNTVYMGFWSVVGVYAPGVELTGPLYVHDIHTGDFTPAGLEAPTAALLIGGAGEVRITGGDMLQYTNRPVQVSGIDRLAFTDGQTADGTASPAEGNRGRYTEDGVDVTDQIVVEGAR